MDGFGRERESKVFTKGEFCKLVDFTHAIFLCQFDNVATDMYHMISKEQMENETRIYDWSPPVDAEPI